MRTYVKCYKIGHQQPVPRQKSGTAQPAARHRQAGFTLIEVTIVVLLIGVLSAVAVPNYVRARSDAQVKTCVVNLKQVYAAKQQWALETLKSDTAVPVDTDLASYMAARRMPTCPAGGSYRIRRVSKDPTCSLSAIGHALGNLNMDDDPAAD